MKARNVLCLAVGVCLLALVGLVQAETAPPSAALNTKGLAIGQVRTVHFGGPQTLMIGRVLWDEFFSNNDWPMASSVAVVMILLIIVPLAIFNRYQAQAQEARK